MLGAGLDFLPVSLPEQQDQQLLPEQQDQQILPEIIPSDQTTPTPETVSQHPLSQPSIHGLSATPDWPSPALHPPDFCWGSHEGKAYYDAVTTAYNEVIHWRRNVFLVPSGTTGKAFVSARGGTKSFETPFSKDFWGRAEPGGPSTSFEWEWEWKPNTHAHYILMMFYLTSTPPPGGWEPLQWKVPFYVMHLSQSTQSSLTT